MPEAPKAGGGGRGPCPTNGVVEARAQQRQEGGHPPANPTPGAELLTRCGEMNLRLLPILIIIAVAALVGCKGKEYSRVYEADMETAWEAALSVVQKLTDAEPERADREAGVIVTKWATVSYSGRADASGVTEEGEVAKGTISIAAVESGTKVTIRVERRTARAEQAPERGVSSGTVGISLTPTSGGIEKMFLDELGRELERPQAPEAPEEPEE